MDFLEKEMIKMLFKKPIRNSMFVLFIILILLTNIWSGFFSKLLYLTPNIMSTDKTQIHFISVGQGDAVAIKFASGETMLIDSGTELYRSKLIRYLDNIVLDGKKIDYVVLTHPDLDHSGNMEYIVNNYDIGVFYRPPIYLESEVEEGEKYSTNKTYANIIKTLKSRDIRIEINSALNEIKVGNSKISWIYPDKDDLIYDEDDESNIYSAVMILEDNGKRAMFTGDISESVERLLMNTYDEEVLDVDILKVAHHGSSGSTSSDFLDATSPDYAFISVGENSYGHPANAMFDRIIDYDSTHGTSLYDNIYRTDVLGNIICTLDDEVIIENVDNVDKYSFTPFWIYTVLAVVALIYFMFLPYIKLWHKEWVYNKRNKNYGK